MNRVELLIEGTIHPTQKPIKLYKRILRDYAKPEYKIIDTHGGSMSSVIACIDGGFDITCCEIDAEYFASGVSRVKNHVKQLDMFIKRPEIIVKDTHINI
jgi:site-specific DNA-methyltransferase (adenine-specific)